MAFADRVFFACGANHILAYAFLERYGDRDRRVVWLKLAAGLTGNHAVWFPGITQGGCSKTEYWCRPIGQ
jgi:hypothetical protein